MKILELTGSLELQRETQQSLRKHESIRHSSVPQVFAHKVTVATLSETTSTLLVWETVAHL